MLLALNVGNSQTDIGILDGDRVVERWQISTLADRTPDEYSLLLRGLLADNVEQIRSAAMASVVPAAAQSLELALVAMVERVLVVGPGVKTGMPMTVDNPREVGADRVASAVAAKEFHGFPAVVVGFGTAVTVDVVDVDGSFIGGSIAAGMDISLDALVSSTAALRRVALVPPARVIGRNTVEAIQSGMVYGFAGMVDGLVRRAVEELGAEATLVATGHRAPTLAPLLDREYAVDEILVLRGLGLLSARNQ